MLVREVMTPHPVCLPTTATVVEAAAQMRANHIGDVVMIDGLTLAGMVTDRDIVVRAVAAGLDPNTTALQDVASGEPIAIGPDEPVEKAIKLMRDKALRRLPVTDGDGEVLGIVSLGDLAEKKDPK